jgi:hypothetical protein
MFGHGSQDVGGQIGVGFGHGGHEPGEVAPFAEGVTGQVRRAVVVSEELQPT